MKVIKPTPSQAAVALKKFFAKQGISIQLSQAQEAIAVTNGYPSWNVLASDVPTRKVNEVPADGAEFADIEDLELWAVTVRMYGDEQDTLYLGWSEDGDAAIKAAALSVWTDHGNDPADYWDSEFDTHPDVIIGKIEQIGSIVNGKFSLVKGLHPRELSKAAAAVATEPATAVSEAGPTLQDIIDLNAVLVSNGVTDEDDRLRTIQDVMKKAADECGLLDDWTYQGGRGELWMEDGVPLVQVSYDKRINTRFTTEIVLTLRNHEVAAYVRTWHFYDNEEPSRNYGIFEEESGDFDTDALRPELDEPVSLLLKNAVAEAKKHKAKLREVMGFN